MYFMPRYELSLKFEETENDYLLDYTSFLYDFELLHDYYIIISNPKYDEYYFSRFFWFRKGRSINPEDRLQLGKIKKESPLELTLIVTSLYVLDKLVNKALDLIDRVHDAPLDREAKVLDNKIKRLKAKQMEKELERDEQENARLDKENTRLEQENQILRRILKRLLKSKLKIAEIDINDAE